MTTPGPLNANYVSLVEPFIDVKKDFHAAGDGISDDSAAINAAISAAATNFGAGTVYFPPGLRACGRVERRRSLLSSYRSRHHRYR